MHISIHLCVLNYTTWPQLLHSHNSCQLLCSSYRRKLSKHVFNWTSALLRWMWYIVGRAWVSCWWISVPPGMRSMVVIRQYCMFAIYMCTMHNDYRRGSKLCTKSCIGSQGRVPYLSPFFLLIFPAFVQLSLPHVEPSLVLSCTIAIVWWFWGCSEVLGVSLFTTSRKTILNETILNRTLKASGWACVVEARA